MSSSPSIDLRLFYEKHFRPQKLNGAPASEKHAYRACLRWLQTMLGRPPLLSDMTQNVLLELFGTLADHDLPLVRRYQLANAFMGLSQEAHEFIKGGGCLIPPKQSPAKRLPPIVGEPGTLPHYFQHDYAPQVLQHCCLAHRRRFGSMFRKQRLCFGRDLLLNELSATALAEYLSWLGSQGLKLYTVKQHRALFLAIWRHAHDAGRAPQVSRVRRMKVPREEPDCWSLEEIGRIISAARDYKGAPIAGIQTSDYWPALLLVGWYTGLRHGSLKRLRPSDFDLDAAALYVPAAAMKHFVGKRFKLGADAVAAVRKIYDPRRTHVFPEPATGKARRFFDDFRKILRLAAVSKSRLRLGYFHKLRRSTATHVAVKAGLNAASALLGHSTAHLLQRYIDPRYDVQTDATQWLPSPTGPELPDDRAA
jgi:integrase